MRKEADTGELYHRPPRKRAPYLGTDRYCSIHVHKREEQGRRDDLWSFLYMMVEFIVGQLPWRSSSYRGEYLLKDCPIEFYKIYDHIRRLQYMDKPNYELIKKTMKQICERRHYSTDDPFDWEKGGSNDGYPTNNEPPVDEKHEHIVGNDSTASLISYKH
ncbi:unnamed protein product [Toxocara canis]|uniref:Protein kinase domain-containing protein n=1 Tax=Toxocara canis TaxID=6265 RepID=A0A3P7GII7_TOXCA|nr:unnamed protein product [Toxocara canis]